MSFKSAQGWMVYSLQYTCIKMVIAHIGRAGPQSATSALSDVFSPSKPHLGLVLSRGSNSRNGLQETGHTTQCLPQRLREDNGGHREAISGHQIATESQRQPWKALSRAPSNTLQSFTESEILQLHSVQRQQNHHLCLLLSVQLRRGQILNLCFSHLQTLDISQTVRKIPYDYKTDLIQAVLVQPHLADEAAQVSDQE